MSLVGKEIEEGERLLPRFEKSALLPCVTVDADSGEVLMVAYMNQEALEKTLETGKATYFSRTRGMWVKGETSGHFQRVVELRVDCDQDCFLLRVRVDGACCHMGYRSCFYRRWKPGTKDVLEYVIAEKSFDPAKVYGKGS
jgi:phosphoribosyl-AMP cyclohydrolase